MTSEDADFLAHAVGLALDNAAEGAPPFGAVVTRNGKVLATGVNTTTRDADPTAHAELAAIGWGPRPLGEPPGSPRPPPLVRSADRPHSRPGTLELGGATIYSSCEPCPMCVATAALVGVSRVVHAAAKEDAARVGFVLPERASALQAVWRASGAVQVEHVPIPGAEEPFARFAEQR
jgi:guanine deaminase